MGAGIDREFVRDMRNRVLVTGGNGFVGRSIVRKLADEKNWQVRASVRSESSIVDPAAERVLVNGLGMDTNWRRALEGVAYVVHTAGLSSVPPTSDGVSELNRVNVSGTENLARQAADAGVRRFVFISTVKVHGESTGKGRPFLESDDPAPTGPYAISKLEAEQSLSAVSVDTGMEVVIIRPPLIYGPGVKASFLSMMKWVVKQRPLPFGRLIDNRRSFLAVNNLSDMVFRCLESPEAANRVFLASDDDDMSTAELFRRLGEAAGRPAQLINVPAWVLQSFGTLFRKKDIAQRLCGSLQVDITRARTVLGWEPPMSVNDSLKQAVNELITSQKA